MSPGCRVGTHRVGAACATDREAPHRKVQGRSPASRPGHGFTAPGTGGSTGGLRGPTRNTSCEAAASGPRGEGALLLAAVLILLAGHVVDGREGLDALAGDLPRLLDDPRQRAVLAGRLLLDLLEHVLREVEGLLPLVSSSHARTLRGRKGAHLRVTPRLSDIDRK